MDPFHTPPDSFADLIEKLGGAAKVAKSTGEAPGTVQQRKARDSFPPETWPKLIELAQQSGLTNVDEALLLSFTRPRQRKAEAGQQDAA